MSTANFFGVGLCLSQCHRQNQFPMITACDEIAITNTRHQSAPQGLRVTLNSPLRAHATCLCSTHVLYMLYCKVYMQDSSPAFGGFWPAMGVDVGLTSQAEFVNSVLHLPHGVAESPDNTNHGHAEDKEADTDAASARAGVARATARSPAIRIEHAHKHALKVSNNHSIS